MILRPVFCVMCSYKFSQYDTTASILMFMKCISSTSETKMAVNFKARWKVRSCPRRSPLATHVSAIKARFDGSFFFWNLPLCWHGDKQPPWVIRHYTFNDHHRGWKRARSPVPQFWLLQHKWHLLANLNASEATKQLFHQHNEKLNVSQLHPALQGVLFQSKIFDNTIFNHVGI